MSAEGKMLPFIVKDDLEAEEITHATTVSRQDAEASITDGLRRAVTYQ